ncbi:DNA topoisomerase I [Candidatus Woesearchaeota archaeon B3_Woes]|nr:MAG: DNA topoisomerase I [Candidatus Woesearchaeota archaeon B3_Woes]
MILNLCQKMVELIICEKPNAANKIAEALADGKPIKNTTNKVVSYEITHGDKDIIVGCAVGHLYGLKQKEKRAPLPIFDIEWVPTYDINKGSAFSKKYTTVLKRLAKKADTFTVATDYDIEGEVIGLNIVKFICKKNDAKRMKFSTLTKDELVKSYENAQSTLDWGQANAGVTRHFLDWFYGVNVSKALTKAISTTGGFKLMSTGRVQGPSLKMIVDKEKEIKAFIPDPYWMLSLNGKVNQQNIEAWHEKDKIFDKKDAEKILNKIKDEKQAKIKETETKKFNQEPPTPFDLTSLQIEAHKCLKISPKKTLEIAQELYTGGNISYPRTSSQQLPESIEYKKILNGLLKSKNYKESVDFLLKKKTLKPNNGKKTDPAHPAIYPTGIIPKAEEEKLKLYDLIVRRFLATFGDSAVRQTIKAKIDVKEEIFITKGTTTVEQGWHILYGKYAMFKEEELPDMKKGDKIDISKITKWDKETTPPKRYTESSIIKELEKRNLGTKSTRAQIIDTLFQRGYIDGKAIEATELGIRTSETLAKHCETLVNEKLTRHFEEEMSLIRESKKTKEEVIEEAKKIVTDIIKKFKKDEKEVGEELLAANRETINVMTHIGNCPNCKEGSLSIRRGKFGHFIACDKYPDCKTIFSLPAALIKPTKNICETCGLPKVLIIKKRKRPQELCINSKCSGKMENHTKEQLKEIDDIENGNVEKPCPKCKEGQLVVRKSIYGAFLGCNKYPKCRFTEKIEKEE